MHKNHRVNFIHKKSASLRGAFHQHVLIAASGLGAVTFVLHYLNLNEWRGTRLYSLRLV